MRASQGMSRPADVAMESSFPSERVPNSDADTALKRGSSLVQTNMKQLCEN